MASRQTGKKKAGGQKTAGAGRSPTPKRTASKQAPATQRQAASLPPRRTMPVWLQNVLIGLIIFTLTLRLGLLVQYVVCALALGVAVYQIWNRRARWLWTWTVFIAVGLYLAGVVSALHYQPAWFLYFGAWILVIVSLVGEGSRSLRRRR